MSETVGVNVLKRAYNMEVSPQFDGYSGVRIFVGTDDDGNPIVIEAGNDAGQVLEIKNPFGTQAMANNILTDIRGYQYQPMSAESAQLNPAAEMGDGVTVNGVYSGIFVRATQFGRLMASDISAPTDEEIEHEFAIESPTDRQYTRFVQQSKAAIKLTNLAIEAEVEARTEADAAINATLSIHATEIAARVTKTGKNGSNTFGWSLDADGFYIHNGVITDEIKRNKSALFTFTNTGLKIQGEIRATSGSIGGFTIGSNSIYSNGMSSMNSGQSTGVHVGTDGIKLGQKFSVNTSGKVEATDMVLSGTLRVGGEDITAARLRSGAESGYNWSNGGYEGYGSRAAYSLAGAGGGLDFNLSTDRNSGKYPGFFRADYIYADDLRASSDFYVKGRFASGWETDSWYDRDGGYHFIRYLSS